MNDASTLKAPGWQRVVAELTAPAADTNIFLLRMLSVLGQVSGARQAVLHVLVPGGQGEEQTTEVRPAQVWPLSPDVVDAQGKLAMPSEAVLDPARLDAKILERPREIAAAARQAASTKQTTVYALEEGAAFYEGDAAKWFVIAAPIAAASAGSVGGMGGVGESSAPRCVVTMLVESRSRQGLQATLAAVELITGYVRGHDAQQALRRAKQSSQAMTSPRGSSRASTTPKTSGQAASNSSMTSRGNWAQSA